MGREYENNAMLDPDYTKLSGPGRLFNRDTLRRVRCPQSGAVSYRWVRLPAVAVDIGRAPAVDGRLPDLPQSDIMTARRVRAAGLYAINHTDRNVSFYTIHTLTGLSIKVVQRHIDRDPVFDVPADRPPGFRSSITLARRWEEHAARDVPDPDRCRWALDGIIRWFRDKDKPARSIDIARYSDLNRKTITAFFSVSPGLFQHVGWDGQRKIHALTTRARKILLPLIVAAVIAWSALALPAPVSADDDTPRPAPTAQSSRYRRYDSGGSSSSTPRCRWNTALGRYQCNAGGSGSRYGRDQTDVPGTDRRAPGVPTPRPTPAR